MLIHVITGPNRLPKIENSPLSFPLPWHMNIGYITKHAGNARPDYA